MTHKEHHQRELQAPMHQRLQAIQSSLASGSKNLRPFGAELDSDGSMITLETPQGPAVFWARNLAAMVHATTARYLAKHPAPLRTIAPAPAPAKAAVRPAPAAKAKPAKREALPTWSAHRVPVGCAPKRAVGNFSTHELRAQTIADLQHNLREAQRAGCDALARVMVAALEAATARPVDVNGAIQK